MRPIARVVGVPKWSVIVAQISRPPRPCSLRSSSPEIDDRPTGLDRDLLAAQLHQALPKPNSSAASAVERGQPRVVLADRTCPVPRPRTQRPMVPNQLESPALRRRLPRHAGAGRPDAGGTPPRIEAVVAEPAMTPPVVVRLGSASQLEDRLDRHGRPDRSGPSTASRTEQGCSLPRQANPGISTATPFHQPRPSAGQVAAADGRRIDDSAPCA